MKKNSSTAVPTSKSDLIRKLIKKGKTTGQIREAVEKVFATCYYSEIKRVKDSVAAEA